MKSSTNPLIGVWKLVSFHIKRKNGHTHFPFGKNPIGQFIFTENNLFSTQFSQLGRMPIKSGDIMDASHEEMAASFRGYISYFGRYDFNPSSNELLLHLDGSLFPNWENDTLKRKAVLKGDKMEIKTEDVTYGGEQIIGVVNWQKVN